MFHPRRYYAVARGRRPGIYTHADLALEQTLGFSGFVLRRFFSLELAEAFLRGHGTAQVQDEWTLFDDMVGEVGTDFVQVVIAGHCERDGRADAKAGYALVSPTNPTVDNDRVLPTNISHPHTVYCAEFAAVLEAMLRARGALTLEIITSNKLLIAQLTEHIQKWRRNGWRACTGYPLMYRSLLRRIDVEMRNFNEVRFKYLAEVADAATHYNVAFQRATQAARS